MKFTDGLTLVIIGLVFYTTFSALAEVGEPHSDVHSSNPEIAGKTYLESWEKESSSVIHDRLRSWLGVPYVYGGNSRKGTDCSGFVQQFYADQFNVDLQRSARNMYDDIQPIKKKELKPGDLIFFKIEKNPISHVGIYWDNDSIIHASSSAKQVIFSKLEGPYYEDHFYAAGRVMQSGRY